MNNLGLACYQRANFLRFLELCSLSLSKMQITFNKLEVQKKMMKILYQVEIIHSALKLKRKPFLYILQPKDKEVILCYNSCWLISNKQTEFRSYHNKAMLYFLLLIQAFYAE